MVSTAMWDTIHAERLKLADDLADLSAEQWATPSLCSGWNVQQMLGHMTATAKMTPPKFAAKMLSAGFRFNKMSAAQVAGETSGTPAQTLAEFRAHATDSTSPPGPAQSWLGETVVHATDIRWPLGIEHEFPIPTLVEVADFYKGSNVLIGAKRRISGFRLRAADADWATGDGPEIAGPMLALVMAMTGRKAAVDRLSGAQLEAFTARI